MYLPMLTNEELVCYMRNLNDLSAREQELLSRLLDVESYKEDYEDEIAWLKQDVDNLSCENDDLRSEINQLTSEIEKLTEELGKREG